MTENEILNLIMNLSTKYAKKYNCQKEELYSIAYEGYHYALLSYTPKKNSNLKAYLIQNISWFINKQKAHELKAWRKGLNNYKPEISINTKISDEVEIKDILEINFYNFVEFEDNLDKILSKLGNKEKWLLSYILSGYTYLEIAEILEIKKKSVDNLIYKLRKKLKEIIEKEDV